METEADILVVDDDRDLTSLMSEYLSEQGFAVSVAHDGPQGLREALKGQSALVVLDVMMPGFDGFELLRRLRESSAVPVLMLTARTEAQDRIQGLNQGADDYVPKPFDPMELVARIRAILRRVRPPAAPESPVEVSGIRLDPPARRVYQAGKVVDVTSVEYDILSVLMRAAGRVVSRDELMKEMYGRESTPFDRSIDVHISHLRRKLEASGDLIRTIRGVGYQFAVERPPGAAS